jgi:hypothetical protein
MLVKLLTIKNSVFISIVVIPETTYPDRNKQMNKLVQNCCSICLVWKN